jgi:hypothetical protein
MVRFPMYLLPEDDYHKLGPLIGRIPFNTLFAQSIIKKHLKGTIHVDDPINPNNAYILHPYGMSLLVGDAKDQEFESWLLPYLLNRSRERHYNEWMQVSEVWNERIADRLGDHIVGPGPDLNGANKESIEKHERVNFVFSPQKYKASVNGLKSQDAQIIRLDSRTARRVRGTVVPSAFWNNLEEFAAQGIGFSVVIDDELVSTAFTAFVSDEMKEIGIETTEKFRGRGFARLASIAFIDHCLRESHTPIWSCRFGNSSSYNLAIGLGFEPTYRLPYYRLCRE